MSGSVSCDHLIVAFLQILRWNWCRATVALYFARAVTPMSVALRHSILPLIDSIIDLALPNGVDSNFPPTALCPHEAALIRRSSIDLQLFTHSKYFEAETNHFAVKPNAKVRKAADS